MHLDKKLSFNSYLEISHDINNRNLGPKKTLNKLSETESPTNHTKFQFIWASVKPFTNHISIVSTDHFYVIVTMSANVVQKKSH